MPETVAGIKIYNRAELHQMSTEEIRMSYNEARGAGLLGYASLCLDTWEEILQTNYPRRIDRQS